MPGMELILRSRTSAGMYQEIRGALIAYNLIRREIADAAAEAKLAPTDISFVRAFQLDNIVPAQFRPVWGNTGPIAPCDRPS
jgi:hypothetical protein